MASRIARARIRKDKDDDIAQVWDSLPKNTDKSDIVRAALRLYFGLGEQQVINRTNIKLQPSIEAPVLAKKEPDITKDSGKALDDLFGKY
jgi:hypothetical protein